MRLLDRRQQKVVAANSNPKKMQLAVDLRRISQCAVVVLTNIGDSDSRAEGAYVRKLIQVIQPDPERLGTAHG